MKKSKQKSKVFSKILLISTLIVTGFFVYSFIQKSSTPLSINEISPTGTVALSLSPANVTIDTNVNTKISLVADSGADQLSAVSFKLLFDSTKLTVSNLTIGTRLTTVLPPAPVIGVGTIKGELGGTTASSPTGSGTIISFDVKGATPGVYDITFDIPFSQAVLLKNDSANALKSATKTTITIKSPAVAPSISQHPTTQTVNAGSNVTLSVVGTGNPTPTYQWFKAGQALSGKTSSTLAFPNIATTDAGSYTVSLTNSVSTITSNAATLTVVSPPSITTQPVSNPVVGEGKTLNLSVVAAGTPPLTYQWYLGTTALTGKTASTLSIPETTPLNAGSYTVKVSNSTSSITSTPTIVSIKLGGDISGTTRVVDVQDFFDFITNYHVAGSIADINGSGQPDVFDFTKLVNQFGDTW